MADRQVTRRYAQALYEEADRQGHLEEVDADVDLLRQSLEEAPALERLLKSPVVPQDKKKAVLDSLVEPRVCALTYRFVELLLRKKRAEAMAGVLAAYRDLRDEQEGIVEASARVAEPLSEDGRRRLEDALVQMTGRQVRLSLTRDPSLIGGLVVRVGDTVYDGSVQHQLRSLRERLAHHADVSGAMNGAGDGGG